MSGEFVRVGQASFPGAPHIPCSRSEWRSTKPEKHGRFSVRFLSPDGMSGPRRYWVEPLLEQVIQGTPTRFLEQACEYGYKIVAEIERHSETARDAYRLASHLFRNRNAGHTSIDRVFLCAADFVDFSQPECPSLVTPGSAIPKFRLPESATIHAKASALLKRAFLEQGDRTLASKPANFAGVLRVYEQMVSAEAGGKPTPLTPLTTEEDEEDTDDLFIYRCCHNLDYQQVEAQVASALIYGQTTLRDDLEAWKRHPDKTAFLTAQS